MPPTIEQNENRGTLRPREAVGAQTTNQQALAGSGGGESRERQTSPDPSSAAPLRNMKNLLKGNRLYKPISKEKASNESAGSGGRL